MALDYVFVKQGQMA